QDVEPAESSAPAGPVLDTDELMQSVDGDLELMREIVAVFLDELPRMRSRIHDALELEDAEALSAAAHALKGAVGNLGASAAFEAAGRVEELGRVQDLSSSREAHESLRTELERLQPALEALQREAVA